MLTKAWEKKTKTTSQVNVLRNGRTELTPEQHSPTLLRQPPFSLTLEVLDILRAKLGRFLTTACFAIMTPLVKSLSFHMQVIRY